MQTDVITNIIKPLKNSLKFLLFKVPYALNIPVKANATSIEISSLLLSSI